MTTVYINRREDADIKLHIVIPLLLHYYQAKNVCALGRESVEVLVCGADFWVLLVVWNVSAERGDDRRQLIWGEHVVLVVAGDRVGDGQLLETLAADPVLVAREPGHGGAGIIMLERSYIYSRKKYVGNALI